MQSYELTLRAEPVTRSSTWPIAGTLCIAVLTLLPLLFYGTMSHFVSAWNNTTAYSYCFLILPICAYLVWERREALLSTSPTPSVVGFALLIAAGAIWLLGDLTGTVVVSELALVAMAQSIVVAVLGIQAARAITFPLIYLTFLVPAGESLIPALQTVTASAAVALLKITGIPVRSDGLLIYLPNSTWLVAEACAGVKFLIASVALGALLSGIFLRNWRRRMLFMGLSVVVPIVANGFRAFVIIVIGYLTDKRYAVGADHILYGWVLFALVLFGMIGIAVAMRDDVQKPDAESPTQTSTRSRAAAASRSFATAALCCLLLAVSVKAGASAVASPPGNIAVPHALPLLVQQPWRAIDAQDPAPPEFSGADQVWHQAYKDGAAKIYLTVGYFGWERPGAEAASSLHHFTNANSILQKGEDWRSARVAQTSLSVSTLTFATRQNRRLLWHWLWVDGSYIGNPYLAKLLQLKVKLFGGPPAAAIISIATDYTGDENPAAAVLARFARSIGPINQPVATTPNP
jgi:exosortase A